MFPENFHDEAELGKELTIAKFRSFGLEKFQDLLNTDSGIEEFLRNTTRHYSFNLPIELNEYLINEKTIIYTWLSGHPALSAAEELFKLDKPDTITIIKQNNSIAEIKKFYTNWLLQKNEKEKQYFALSIINLIEKDAGTKEYVKQFMYATILAYEKSINSPEKAVQVLYKVKENIENSGGLNPDLKKELLYFALLFLGFIYLKEGAISEADNKFYEALNVKQNGITAMFYCAKTQLMLGNNARTLEFINGLVAFDKTRFNYAIKNNNLVMINYFLNNAVIYNVFNDESFAFILNDLDFILKTALSPESTHIDIISDRLESLNELPIKEFFDEETIKNIRFLVKYIENFKTNKNFLLLCITEFLGIRFNAIISKIIENIKKHYFDKVKDELALYTAEIEKNTHNIVVLQRELEDNKLKAGKRLDESIKIIESNATDKITALEKRIQYLDDDHKFNPGSAFNTAMMYNIIISLIIFIIGGFGMGFSDSGSGEEAFNTIFTTIIINGTKWGGIAFLLGLIASFISATNAVWERSNEKNRLIKQIALVKTLKDKEIAEWKEEHDRMIRQFEKNFNDRIKSLENTIERITNEKNEKSKELYNNAEEKIKDISIYLESLKIPLA
jgi:hypothetical protein